MRNLNPTFPFSPIILCAGVTAVLLITYIGIIAVVMSYATLTVEFSQSVRNDEAAVAVLENRYLNNINSITTADYSAAGYSLPTAKIFVPAKSVTALR